MTTISPALILIVGALPLPFLPRLVRVALMLALPVAGFVAAMTLEDGAHWQVAFMGADIELLRLDGLSRAFTYVFLTATFLAGLYCAGSGDDRPGFQAASLVYAGSAVGGVLAGDLISLFVFWELSAIASVFLIWARGTERAYRSGMRYLLIQVGSGVLLMSGAILHVDATGSAAFGALELNAPGGLLIFLAFGIKCAFPLLHTWLTDSYPEATPGGTVVLSVFTTKLAVYALARSYAGEDVLVPIGALMAVFPILYALIENDLRRLLAYSLISQLGFMVTGIGIGTELALNGTVAHAFCSVLYQALLFMAIGVVVLRTGTAKASELGGLGKSMPWTAGFCLVGAASISAFPLFSGFVSKSMILSAAAEGQHGVAWTILLVGSVGAFLHSGIRVPFVAFFGRDSGKRPAEAPMPTLLAMAATAALCIGIGVRPEELYAVLPFAVDYAPYTTEHVVTQLQLLLFAGLGFVWLMRSDLYPRDLPSVNLDAEAVYRRLLPQMVGGFRVTLAEADATVRRQALWIVRRTIVLVHGWAGPGGFLARSGPVGTMALWVVGLLGTYLIVNFL